MKKAPRMETNSSGVLQLLGAAAVPVVFAPGTVTSASHVLLARSLGGQFAAAVCTLQGGAVRYRGDK